MILDILCTQGAKFHLNETYICIYECVNIYIYVYEYNIYVYKCIYV